MYILGAEMNKFIFLLLILITTNSFGEDSKFISAVSFVGMSMDYTEYDRDGSILDTEESSYLDLAGVEISFGYNTFENDSSSSEITFNFMILGGMTKYIGSMQSSNEGYGSHISSTLNTVVDTDISYKRSNVFNNSVEINYGIGIGYREWNRALSNSQIEGYTWYSIRPMLGISTFNKEKLNFGMFIEYQYGIETMMSASDLNYDFTLGGADILEISFPISYKYDKNIDFFFEATIQKQTIKESNRLYTGNGNEYYYEPKSTAHNNYLKFGIEYRF